MTVATAPTPTFARSVIATQDSAMLGLTVDGTVYRISVSLELITPTVALHYLEMNLRNRKPKRDRIIKYARDMELGRWVLNGQGIVFDDQGVLIDGQNRLHAIIQSKASAVVLVLRDVQDPNAQATQDRGAPRSMGDDFTMGGLRNGRDMASLIRLAWAMDLTGEVPASTSKYAPTEQEMTEYLASYAEELDRALVVGRTMATARLMPKSLAGSLFFHFARVDAVATESFFEVCVSGVGLEEGDALLALRARLTANAASRSKLPARYIAALTVKAWLAHRADRKVRNLKWSTNEAFPSWE